MIKKEDLDKAYNMAKDFARNHYENFPVISIFIPEDIQPHIAIIYWFSRTADDIADEGNLSDEERLLQLDNFEKRFIQTLLGNFQSPFDYALYNTIVTKKLPSSLFTDLISAFKQDITQKRYNSFDDIMDYCRRSANPVGRLLLLLFKVKNSNAALLSDRICTALQLTNFYQDTSIDILKNRIYYPLNEFDFFNVKEADFFLDYTNDNLKKLVNYNVDRTYRMFEEGKGLLPYLKGLFRQEISWTIKGGVSILDKIKKNDYDVLSNRPKLSKIELLFTLLKPL